MPIATAPEPSQAVTMCPFCRSPKLTTTSVKADATSYRRCEACGEVRNTGRLRPSWNRLDENLRWR
jgi:transcription elongation factor Elf1